MSRENWASTWPPGPSACGVGGPVPLSPLTIAQAAATHQWSPPDTRYHAKHLASIIPFAVSFIGHTSTNENERLQGPKCYAQSQEAFTPQVCPGLDPQSIRLPWDTLLVVWLFTVGTTPDGKEMAERRSGLSLSRQMCTHVKRKGTLQKELVVYWGSSGRIPALLRLTALWPQAGPILTLSDLGRTDLAKSRSRQLSLLYGTVFGSLLVTQHQRFLSLGQPN